MRGTGRAAGVVCGVGLCLAGAGPAAALPSLPSAQAEVQNYDRASFGAGVDAVGASDPLVGTADWYADILNDSVPPLLLPGATIEVGSAAQLFQPPVSFPAVSGPTDLGQFESLALDLTGAQNMHFSTGFAASRSAVPANWTLPAGGGTETVTVTFTPAVATGSALLQVITPFSDAVTSSIETGNVTLSGFGPGDLEFEDLQSGIASVGVTPQIGHTYSISVPVDVSSGGVFKPQVVVTTDNFTFPGDSTGPSVTIPDPLLADNFVFSDLGDAQWSVFVDRGATASFGAAVPTELAELQALLVQTDALLPGASRRDAARLRDAAGALSDAAVPSRWAPTGNSLDPRRGAQVFVDLAQAAQSLSPVAGAQSLVGDLVATGRGLARRALDADASQAGETAFSLGDRAAANSQAAGVALVLYGVAWRFAVR